MASNSIGRLEAFDLASDSLTAYVALLRSDSVEENKQVAAFLTAVGKDTYQLLRTLLTPELPKDKSFKDIVAVLKAHFEPNL